jgi:hypothetical protein
VVVTLKEWVNTLDEFGIKESWKIKHNAFLVFAFVLFENFLKNEFNRLVSTKFNT